MKYSFAPSTKSAFDRKLFPVKPLKMLLVCAPLFYFFTSFKQLAGRCAKLIESTPTPIFVLSKLSNKLSSTLLSVNTSSGSPFIYWYSILIKTSYAPSFIYRIIGNELTFRQNLSSWFRHPLMFSYSVGLSWIRKILGELFSLKPQIGL